MVQHNTSVSSYIENNTDRPNSSTRFYTASRSLYFSRPKSLSFSTHERSSQVWSFDIDTAIGKGVSSIPNLTVNRLYDEMKASVKCKRLSDVDGCYRVENDKTVTKTDTIEIQYSECVGNEEEEEDASSQKDEGFVENLGYDMVDKQKVMKVTSLTLLEFAQQVSAGMVNSFPLLFSIYSLQEIQFDRNNFTHSSYIYSSGISCSKESDTS